MINGDHRGQNASVIKHICSERGFQDFGPTLLEVTQAVKTYLAGVAEAARRRDFFSPWPADLFEREGV